MRLPIKLLAVGVLSAATLAVSVWFVLDVLATRTPSDPSGKDGVEPSNEPVEPTPLDISKEKISFDPRSCEVGASAEIADDSMTEFHETLHARVKILGRADGQCLVEYRKWTSEQCGVGNMRYISRIAVPVNAGPVTIEIGPKRERGLRRGITESFPKECQVIFNYDSQKTDLGKYGVARALVKGEAANEYIEFNMDQNGKELRKGDKVKFSYMAYDSEKFNQPLSNTKVVKNLEFEVGSDKMWPWLAAATENMAVLERRAVRVPVALGDRAAEWLPGGYQGTAIYAMIRLESIDPAK